MAIGGGEFRSGGGGKMAAAESTAVKKMARGISRVTDNHDIVYEARHQLERGFREASIPNQSKHKQALTSNRSAFNKFLEVSQPVQLYYLLNLLTRCQNLPPCFTV